MTRPDPDWNLTRPTHTRWSISVNPNPNRPGDPRLRVGLGPGRSGTGSVNCTSLMNINSCPKGDEVETNVHDHKIDLVIQHGEYTCHVNKNVICKKSQLIRDTVESGETNYCRIGKTTITLILIKLRMNWNLFHFSHWSRNLQRSSHQINGWIHL